MKNPLVVIAGLLAISGVLWLAGSADGQSTPFAPPAAGGPERVWNTFLGGAARDWAFAIVVDGDRNTYLTGLSAATWGSPVNPYAGGYDIFVAKLDPNGTLLWNTFLGG